jgi:hypothetical protein
VSSAPNWAEQLTAIATAVGAIGLLGAIVAAVYAGQQVREAKRNREAQIAAEFFRRWSDLAKTRQGPESLDLQGSGPAAFASGVASDGLCGPVWTEKGSTV